MVGGRYKLASNPIGMVPNAPLASDPGKELQILTLNMIAMHRDQVKI